MLHVIGYVMIAYATIVSFAGPEPKTTGLKNRVIEVIDVYRNVFLIALIGSILIGVQ